METTVFLKALLTAKAGLVIHLTGRALEKPLSETPLLTKLEELHPHPHPPLPGEGPSFFLLSSSSFPSPGHVSPQLVFILPRNRMEFFYLKTCFIFKSLPQHRSTTRENSMRSSIV